MPKQRTEIATGIDRVVVATLPNDWRDEATVVANPANPNNVIAASGRFSGSAYVRSFTVSYSMDGGVSWANSSLSGVNPPPDSRGGFGNPILDFGADGAAYLSVESGSIPQIFRSVDGGATWTGTIRRYTGYTPAILPWFACDPKQPGRLYMTSTLQMGTDPSMGTAFLRSDDFGETWTARELSNEMGRSTAGVFPHISVADSGTIHIAGFDVIERVIMHWRSEDGGENFTFQRATGPVALTGSPFDTVQMMRVTGCIAGDGRVVVAWADRRDGVSRIYYRVTDEGSETWVGPSGGTPLLSTLPATSGAHHVNPRLAVTGNGVIGCAFHEFKEENGEKRMNLLLAASFAWEDGFEGPITVSDSQWDPEASAPEGVSTSKSLVGRYFGFAADASSFQVLWPDTRTGAQVLYFDRVNVPRWVPPSGHSEDVTVYITSEKWFVIARRHGEIIDIIRHPPRGPARDVVRALRELETPDALKGGNQINDPRAARALQHALDEIGDAFAVEGKEQPR